MEKNWPSQKLTDKQTIIHQTFISTTKKRDLAEANELIAFTE